MSRARPRIAIVGAGPAGLFAALRLAEAGAAVTVFDRMASPARKFLMAGRGGLNLTHSEPRAAFLARYREAGGFLAPFLSGFPPPALRAFADGLGEETFIGSSGRIFPRSFKASPLLRAWLGRLEAAGGQLLLRRRWTDIREGPSLRFEGPDGAEDIACDAALLALGGASWPRLGADGGWVPVLRGRGVAIADMVPATMGVQIVWSEALAERFAGAPLKRVAVTAGGETAAGEAMISRAGLEGGVIYALSPALRRVAAEGGTLTLDLKPDLSAAAIAQKLAGARPKDSLSATLRKRLGLEPQAVALLREAGPLPREPEALAARIKTLTLSVAGIASLERAISSAGGIRREAVTPGLELKALPGVFVAGEMLDWEAPTGGYLLQATFATAEAAARAMAERVGCRLKPPPETVW